MVNSIILYFKFKIRSFNAILYSEGALIMVTKVGEIEVYYIDEDLEKLSKKERIKRIDELFKKEYQGK